jgi:hypothetical protein
MNRLLIAIVAGTFATGVWAQGTAATTPSKPLPPALQSAPAEGTETAKKADPAPSVKKQKKKAKKSTVRLGIKARTVK